MSFSSDVKEELSRQVPSARHCQIAEVAAIVSFCGHVKITALNRFSIRIQTENVWVARKFFTLLRKTFKIDTEIAVRRSNNQKKCTAAAIFLNDRVMFQRKVLFNFHLTI